ncbi:DeoR/GlpR family transcriptional regulator of sugar metabolism [Streptomyces sp. B3I7]|nr:DeoR/GlpR family transcriptional regulator of sugar metabolism [Streptomyces sp. B3I7]
MTAYDLDEAAVKKAVIASARRVAAADGGKLGRTAHAHVGPASLVHLLVTDASAPADEVAALEGDGVTVRTV